MFVDASSCKTGAVAFILFTVWKDIKALCFARVPWSILSGKADHRQTGRLRPTHPRKNSSSRGKEKTKNPTKLESESVLQVVSIHSTVEHIPPNSYHNSQLSLAMGSLAEIYTPAKAGESCF